jgi:two-component system CheB/CheR fusion protein
MQSNKQKNDKLLPNYIVALGASAGGLESLTTFFTNMPSDSNMAFVVIQHLSPDHKSMMDTLLARHTQMQIMQAEDGIVVSPNMIYLIPPKHFLTLFNGTLLLNPFDKTRGLHLPIDVFMISLAEDAESRSIGIVFSGTGSDGSIGIQAIKKAGGMTMVQDFETAQFDGMPRSAMATGMIDYTCPPDHMPDIIMNYTHHPCISRNGAKEFVLNPEDTDLNKILALIRNHKDVDFTNYKPNTVIRRIERRMGIVQADSIRKYLDHLHKNKDEIHQLYRDLLIGVTRFFRDIDEFNFLNEHIIPKLFENTKNENKIRVWVAGTSTGEEAYTIVMLLNQYKELNGMRHKISVFATDIDQHALDKAAEGVYPEGIANDLKSDLLDRYFHKIENGFKVKKYIREQVIFARQNVFIDPPFTRQDLITCRNLLIYLQTNLQKDVLDIFHFALKDKGYLFLGTSETVGTLSHHFLPMDKRIKIFHHVGRGTAPLKANYLSQSFKNQMRTLHHIHEARLSLKQKEQIEHYYQSIINEISQLSVVIDETGMIVETFGNPDKFLKFPLGKASMDIKKLVPDKISMIISTGMRYIINEKKSIVYNDLKIGDNNNAFFLNIKMAPVKIYPTNNDYISNNDYVLIVFEENTKHLHDDKDIDVQANTEKHIIDLEKEIQYTRENLQATIEELHTANEELQSTNEELLSSNEELQSTNEELNSVNEELNTVNSEYQEKVEELYESNNDLNNLIRSIDIGTIFLDKHLCIRKFTPAITREINLLSQDIGRPLSDFSSPFIQNLYQDAQIVLNQGEKIERTVRADDGKWFLLNILPYLDEREQIGGVVMTVVDISREKKGSQEMEIRNQYLNNLIDINPLATIVTDKNGIVKKFNQAAEKILGKPARHFINHLIDQSDITFTDTNDHPFTSENNPIQLVLKNKQPLQEYLIKAKLSDQSSVDLSVYANPSFNSDNEVDSIVFVFKEQC